MPDAYHYDISGLSNVYLIGGVVHHDTPYGPGTAITAADALHAVMARELMALARPFTGEEHRFLRTAIELGPDDAAFAAYGIGPQAIRSHERARRQPVTRAMDFALRAIAVGQRPDLAVTRRREMSADAPLTLHYADGRWAIATAH